jgi:branched-chain amino acid transport system permease protein
MQIVSAVIQGILLGGLYALFAAGLSFMFGVMRLVNLAHGALAVLAAYGAVWLVEAGLLSPLLSLVIVVPAMAALGYIAQRFLLQRTLSDSPLPSVLVTFGLAIIISNVLLVTMSANDQGLNAGPIETASITIAGITIGVFPLLILGLAILVLGGLSIVMARTPFGRLVRAVSDDEPTVGLIGANPKHIYALAAAIAFGLVAFAGVSYGIQTTFKPTSGDILLIYAFEAVIIGGLGSLWGTLLGSIILGVVQTVAAAFDTSLFQLAGHVVFLIFLVLLPNGIIRRKVRT